MKVSVVTINYNNGLGLSKTIQSVINQKNVDIEYIIIDGGSTDNSVDIIKQNTAFINYWVSEKDGGIINAVNKGLTKATGDVVVLMNSGDYYLHELCVRQSLDIIEVKKDFGIYYVQIQIKNNEGQTETIIYPESLSLHYLSYMVINLHACFFKKYVFERIGNFSEQYKLAADYHFYLKAIMNKIDFYSLGFPIVYYDIDGASSVRFKEYKSEMNKAWSETIPKMVQDVLDENSKLHDVLTNSRIMKYPYRLFKWIKG